MKSGKHNITIENGSTFEMNLELTNDDDTNYNLTGYTVSMAFRNLNDRLILDADDYVSIDDNHIEVEIPASATLDIADTDGVYQIEIAVSNKEYSVLRGSVEFVKAVIR